MWSRFTILKKLLSRLSGILGVRPPTIVFLHFGPWASCRLVVLVVVAVVVAVAVVALGVVRFAVLGVAAVVITKCRC